MSHYLNKILVLTDFHIRKFRAKDTPPVITLFIELQDAEHKVEPNRRRGVKAAKNYFRRIQKQLNKKPGRIFVVEKQEEIIGLIILFIGANDSIEQPGEHIYISDIIIKNEYQQQGIGTELIRKAERFGRKNKINEIRVNSLIKNTAALNLYHKAGFLDKEISLSKLLK